jgi:hypothetical protein
MRVEDMNAVEHMAYCAELGLDLETTLAILRPIYSETEIGLAYHLMPREVFVSWLETLRLVEMPRGKKKF